MIKVCAQCRIRFEAQRRSAKYCSARCRVAASRDRDRRLQEEVFRPKPATGRPPLSDKQAAYIQELLAQLGAGMPLVNAILGEDGYGQIFDADLTGLSRSAASVVIDGLLKERNSKGRRRRCPRVFNGWCAASITSAQRNGLVRTAKPASKGHSERARRARFGALPSVAMA